MSARSRSVLLGVVLAAAAAGAIWAPAKDPPAGDFLRYERAGVLVARGEASLLYDEMARKRAQVWNDRENFPEKQFRYSPGLAVALAPFGAMGPGKAWILWTALCAALVAGGAALAAEMAIRRMPDGSRKWIPILAVLPLVALYTENVKLGQMNCWAFGLSVGALWALDRRRDAAAGLLAAGATLAKHVPVLLVLWFLWQRRWKAALWGIGGIAALYYVLPTAVLGPTTHHALLRQWAAQEDHLVTEVNEAPNTQVSLNVIHVEGQSVKALLYRYLTPTAFYHIKDLKAGPDAPKARTGIKVNADRAWDPKTVFNVWLGCVFALLAVLVLLTGPLPEELAGAQERRFPLEAGLLLAVMLLVSPESRNPHFQMMSVGLAALAGRFASEPARDGRWWGRVALAGVGTILIAISTQALLGRDGADHALAYGSIGIGAIGIAASLAWTLLRERATAPATEAAP